MKGQDFGVNYNKSTHFYYTVGYEWWENEQKVNVNDEKLTMSYHANIIGTFQL